MLPFYLQTSTWGFRSLPSPAKTGSRNGRSPPAGWAGWWWRWKSPPCRSNTTLRQTDRNIFRKLLAVQCHMHHFSALNLIQWILRTVCSIIAQLVTTTVIVINHMKWNSTWWLWLKWLFTVNRKGRSIEHTASTCPLKISISIDLKNWLKSYCDWGCVLSSGAHSQRDTVC